MFSSLGAVWPELPASKQVCKAGDCALTAGRGIEAPLPGQAFCVEPAPSVG